MSIILFLVALFLLFRGEFTLFNRFITRERGRAAAFLLMIPAGFDICAGFYIGLTLGPDITLESAMNALVESNLAVYQMVVMFGSIGAALYWLVGAPAGAAKPKPAAPSFIVKDVMTPAETAAYLRVTEPDVLALIDNGELPAARIAGQYRIARRAVDDYLASQRAGNPFE